MTGAEADLIEIGAEAYLIAIGAEADLIAIGAEANLIAIGSCQMSAPTEKMRPQLETVSHRWACKQRSIRSLSIWRPCSYVGGGVRIEAFQAHVM